MNLRTPGATKVVGALVLLLVAAAGWMLVLGPTMTELAEVREQTEAARSQNDLLASQLARLEDQAAHLDDTRAVAQALADKFPPTADQPGLFAQVTSAAAAAGIGARDVTALTPTPPTVGSTDPAAAAAPSGSTPGNLARQTVTVAVEGGYAATEALLANLERLPRAYLVTSVTLGGGTEVGRFTTTITGDMFVMSPAPDPADAAKGAVPAVDPGDGSESEAADAP
jgi:hypothetical protein